MKWPVTSEAEHSPPPKEILVKFSNLTRYLFLIEEPESVNNDAVSEDFGRGKIYFTADDLSEIIYLQTLNSTSYFKPSGLSINSSSCLD